MEQKNIIINNDTTETFVFTPIFEYDSNKYAFYIMYYMKKHYSM
jgi:hypothetical protein